MPLTRRGLQYHNGSELVKAARYGWPGKLPERPKWIRTRSLAMLSEMSGLPEAVGGW
jgi:hypothetical protein